MAPTVDVLLSEVRDEIREIRDTLAGHGATLARVEEAARHTASREDLSTAIAVHCADRHGRDSGGPGRGPRIAWGPLLKGLAALAAMIAAALGVYAGGAP